MSTCVGDETNLSVWKKVMIATSQAAHFNRALNELKVKISSKIRFSVKVGSLATKQISVGFHLVFRWRLRQFVRELTITQVYDLDRVCIHFIPVRLKAKISRTWNA